MTDTTAEAAGKAAEPAVMVTASRHFPEWLARTGASLAFTTYQAGKLFLIGQQPDGRLSIFERTLERCMGLAAHGDGFWLSTIFQLWRFGDVLGPGVRHEGYDRLYGPRLSYVTGDLDIHDIGITADGTPVFVNTAFSCLARPSAEYSFEPVWTPPFVSRLAPEDRCHLNGLAMRDGAPAYVTALSRSDVADGWRERRADGGVLVDVASGEIVLSGLSMPHSPRWRDGRLWLLNSGTGEFGWADLDAGRFEPVAFCPGYARGLAFVDGHAVIGLSRSGKNRTFQGLPLDERLKDKDAEARAGLLVVDLATGDAPHWLRIEGLVEELYDVAVLPGVRRPSLIGFKTDEVRRTLRLP